MLHCRIIQFNQAPHTPIYNGNPFFFYLTLMCNVVDSSHRY